MPIELVLYSAPVVVVPADPYLSRTMHPIGIKLTKSSELYAHLHGRTARSRH
jgi:hypothetical protein